jgi:hypothetical protein
MRWIAERRVRGRVLEAQWRPLDFLRIDKLVCQFREIAKGMNVNGYDGLNAREEHEPKREN